MEELNFSNKIANIKKKIKLFQWRNLTLAGRITIIKMLILPNLIHLLSVLPSPKKDAMNQITNMVSSFVWNNKKPNIQMNTLVQEYDLWGQKMLHFAKLQK